MENKIQWELKIPIKLNISPRGYDFDRGSSMITTPKGWREAKVEEQMETNQGFHVN